MTSIRNLVLIFILLLMTLTSSLNKRLETKGKTQALYMFHQAKNKKEAPLRSVQLQPQQPFLLYISSVQLGHWPFPFLVNSFTYQKNKKVQKLHFFFIGKKKFN